MIKTFGDSKTGEFFEGRSVKAFESFARVAARKLAMIHAAVVLQDLKVPPGNKLEHLKGSRSKWHSIRINDQWRVCFIWKDGNAYDVQIEDYH